MSELRLNLLENALDFLLEAVERFDEADPRQIKYAVLNAASAVELVLKARLADEHWTLIFRDPAKATREQYESRRFSSADLDAVMERLKNVCALHLPKHERTIRTLRRKRNEMQHFECSANVAEATSLLVKTWSFLWDFVHEQIPSLSDAAEELLERIRRRMVKQESYVTERLGEIRPEVEHAQDEGNLIVACPSCLQETLIIPGGHDPHCPFCRYQRESQEVADQWATVFVGYPHTDPKEAWDDPVVRECPSCGSEAMIEFEDGDAVPPDPAWVCFSCGDSGSPMTKCHSCGEEFPWEGEVCACPDCRHGVEGA
jgi:hypothetical protein